MKTLQFLGYDRTIGAVWQDGSGVGQVPVRFSI